VVASVAEFPSEIRSRPRPYLHLVTDEPRVAPRRRPTAADYRRRRVVAAGLVLLLLLFAALAVRSALGRIGGGPLAITGAAGASGGVPVAERAWVVRPGDTLWTIALAVDPHGDVRPLVDRLSAQVGGQPLYPGESIRIPDGY
jgi:nucleoid-associated protein YgaU